MAAAFHIENFGCRAARADGEAVGERLRAAGLTEGHAAVADVVIVNTCSVTAEADRSARAYIRRTHRANPDARIMVTGCYAQRAPEELAGLGGVAAVVGNSHKALAPRIAADLAIGEPCSPDGLVPLASLTAAGSAAIWADDRFAHSFLEEAQVLPGAQTRPNLKIQEGCTNRCSFCVIPQTRGSSRSLAAETILKQVEGFVGAGGKELVLSGINLGRWGRDLVRSPGIPDTLAGLVRHILVRTGLPRLRLSSIEPMDWDVELIGLMREYGGSRLARHAHLPLQSGSDRVLRRMHRRYRPWHYAEKVAALVEACGPELTLGADVMAGFPGESEGEFEETLEFIRALPFGYLHLFPFSPRPGTRGWTLHAESPVPASVVDERMAVLRALAAEKSVAHRRQFIGREWDAITLHTPRETQDRGCTVALSENFLPLEIEGIIPANELITIHIHTLQSGGVLGGIPVRTTATSIGGDVCPVFTDMRG
jgi:threonylcarbamoyladenosine tRNA methylthiotransferase MtaB